LKFKFDALRPCSIRLYWGISAGEIALKLFGISPTKENDSKVTNEGGDGESEGETPTDAAQEEEQVLIRRERQRPLMNWLGKLFGSNHNSMNDNSSNGGEDSDGSGDLESRGKSLEMLPMNSLSMDCIGEPINTQLGATKYFAKSSLAYFGVGKEQLFESSQESLLRIQEGVSFNFSYDEEEGVSNYPLIIEIRAEDSTSASSSSSSSISSSSSTSPPQKGKATPTPSQFLIVQFTKVSEEKETFRASVLRHLFTNPYAKKGNTKEEEEEEEIVEESKKDTKHLKEESQDEEEDQDQDDSNSSTVSSSSSSAAKRRRPKTDLLESKDIYGIEDNEPDCIVCLSAPKDATILPCRHFCVCFTCMVKLEKCPVCRCKIKSYMRIHVPENLAITEQHVIDIEKNS
jgi:hypothetical protein